MRAWQKECVRNGPDHDFVPLPGEPKRYDGNVWLSAICRKCGVYR